MTTTTEEPEVSPDNGEEQYSRDDLAKALRTAAYHHPHRDRARQAAAQVIGTHVTDQPKRGSEWHGDGQPGLTFGQYHRSVYDYAARVTVPYDHEAWHRAYESVADALDHRLAPPPDYEPPPDDKPRCLLCHEPIPETRGKRSKFCCDQHRKNAHGQAKTRQRRERLARLGKPPE